MYWDGPVVTKILCPYFRGFFNLGSPLREVPLYYYILLHSIKLYKKCNLREVKSKTCMQQPSTIIHFFKFCYIKPTYTSVCLSNFSFICQTFFGGMPLQSSSTRKTHLYKKNRENKAQVLTKTAVTFEYKPVQTQNLYHRVHYELRNGLLGKLFLLLSFFITNKSEI